MKMYISAAVSGNYKKLVPIFTSDLQNVMGTIYYQTKRNSPVDIVYPIIKMTE